MGKQANLVFLIICSSSLSITAATSGDTAVLSDVAKSLVGVPSNWHSLPNPCSWSGIKCTDGQITSIDLNSKGVSGTLPPSVAQLSSLKNLDLGHNEISGPIPPIAGLTDLQTLDLEGNAFSSVPDNFFSGLSGLQFVKLDNNPLARWSIPLNLALCVSLQIFSAPNTSITGGIPDIFSQLPSLTELNLSYNSLTGELPLSFDGSRIQTLCLNNQEAPGLSGPIGVIGAMPQLQLVWLQSNNFTGPIPELYNLTSLTIFNVRDNQLTGPVPSSLISTSTLKNASLSNNMLQGPFPKFHGNVTVDASTGNHFCNPEPTPCDPRVTVLLSVARGFGYPWDLANSWKGNDPCSNELTVVGGITCDTLGKDIVSLNYAGKHYEGTISPDIANLTSLTEIILNENNLTGFIPDSLTKMPHLQLLDVTNNNLTGKIPEFRPSVSLKTSGNPMLGSHLSQDSGSPHGTLTSPSSGSTSHGSSSSNAATILTTIAVVFVLISCLASLFYYQYYKNCRGKLGQAQAIAWSPNKEMAKVNMTSNLQGLGTGDICSTGNAHLTAAQRMLVSFQALQKATNDFSEANILGTGRFSVVYKGEHNGILIAVKRNISDVTINKGNEELREEVNFLKKVRHRHLVALLGYCMNGKEIILVYEYMPEGTLEKHLFERNANHNSALSWNQKLTIALDVARGIEYLHDLAQDCFIHRDLNPSNILLDMNMRAKVSNFGLIKLVDNKSSMKTRLAGTFGYLAPEYAITGKISTKVDVYAFGVILMELITGRRAIDESLADEESHLVKCFRRNIFDKDKFTSYIDSTLDLDEEALSSISYVGELAGHCTAREPNQRPDMGHVVSKLVPFVEKWNPSHCGNEDDNYNNDSSETLARKLQKWQFGDESTWQFDDGTSMAESLPSYEEH